MDKSYRKSGIYLAPKLEQHLPGYDRAISELEMEAADRAALRQTIVDRFPFDHPEWRADVVDAALRHVSWEWPAYIRWIVFFDSLGVRPRFLAGAHNYRARDEFTGAGRRIEPVIGLFSAYMGRLGSAHSQLLRIEGIASSRPWLRLSTMPDEPASVIEYTLGRWQKGVGLDDVPPYFPSDRSQIQQLSNRDMERRGYVGDSPEFRRIHP